MCESAARGTAYTWSQFSHFTKSVWIETSHLEPKWQINGGQHFNLHLIYLSLTLVPLSFSNSMSRQHGQPVTWEFQGTSSEGTFYVVATHLCRHLCDKLASFIKVVIPLAVMETGDPIGFLLKVLQQVSWRSPDQGPGLQTPSQCLAVHHLKLVHLDSDGHSPLYNRSTYFLGTYSLNLRNGERDTLCGGTKKINQETKTKGLVISIFIMVLAFIIMVRANIEFLIQGRHTAACITCRMSQCSQQTCVVGPVISAVEMRTPRSHGKLQIFGLQNCVLATSAIGDLAKLLKFLFLYTIFSKINTWPTTRGCCELINARMICNEQSVCSYT